MFAGEDDAASRTGQPFAQLWLVGRIERGISAARPRIVLPRHRCRGEKIRRLPQPCKPSDHAGLAFGLGDLTKRTRCLATGKKAEDTGWPLLVFGGVPNGTGRQIGTVGASTASLVPERGLELKQHARRVAVFEGQDRSRLLLGKRWIEVHFTKRCGGQRGDAEVGAQFGYTTLILYRQGHPVGVVSNRPDGGLHEQTSAKSLNHRAWETVVAALDPVELPARGNTTNRQLIDEREQR